MNKIIINQNKMNSRYTLRLTSGSGPGFACQPALKSRQNVKNTVFFVYFQMFFLDLKCEIPEKVLKLTKKVENS